MDNTNFFSRLWNDENGTVVNHFLRGFAKVLMVLTPIVGVALIIIGAFVAMDVNEVLGAVMIIGSPILMFISFVQSVMWLWIATLGNNVAVMRQQGEQDKAKDNSSALPKL